MSIYKDFYDYNSDLPKEVYFLEKEDMYTSNDIFYIEDDLNFNPYNFLYHGIRFDDNFKKLEKIFQEKKLLAGKYIKGYYNYSDNANKGEYVSMIRYNEDDMGFNIFIKENISLLISPTCNAILTKYIDVNTWEKIKDKKTKNLYSYLLGEFMCKDCVSFEFIKAIGVPYRYFSLIKSKEYADDVLRKVIELTKKYRIELNIVDTSARNKILFDNKKKAMPR